MHVYPAFVVVYELNNDSEIMRRAFDVDSGCTDRKFQFLGLLTGEENCHNPRGCFSSIWRMEASNSCVEKHV